MGEKHSAITGVLLIAFGIVGIFVVMVAIALMDKCGGCGEEEDNSGAIIRANRAKRERAKAEAAEARAALPPPDAEPARPGLPPTKHYAKTIIGKSAKDLDRALGAGADVEGGRGYVVDGIPVRVGFQKGKAVWYEAAALPAGIHATAAELIEWLAVDVEEDRFSVDLDGTLPRIWDTKAWERSPGGKAETEAIARSTAQMDALEFLNREFRERGITAMASEDEGDLVIGAAGCDAEVLRGMLAGLRSQKIKVRDGFARVRCAGPGGDVVDAR